MAKPELKDTPFSDAPAVLPAAKKNRAALWAGLFILLALAAAAGYLIPRLVLDPFRTLPPLPIGDYIANANALRGNSYKVTGAVANVLGWSAQKGRLISLDTDEPDNVVPILIPNNLPQINLQKGQRYQLEVSVKDNGLLVARRLTKE